MEAGALGEPGENVPGPVEEEYSFHTVSAPTLSLRMEEDTAWVEEPSTSHATQRNAPLMVITTYATPARTAALVAATDLQGKSKVGLPGGSAVL